MPRLANAALSAAGFPSPKPKRKPIPFPFILEALAPLNPEVRSMFGGHSVYIGDKIIFMLRDQAKSPQDNGLWLIFADEFDTSNDSKSLRRQFPSLRPIELLEGKVKHWMLIPADGPNFESESLQACDLAISHDPRLGRIPKSRS
jgi:hypothetical protein